MSLLLSHSPETKKSAVQLYVNGKSLKYVIQITMDRPEHGGVSGMQIREAKSWGKVHEKGILCDMRADVCLVFPILVANVLDYVGKTKV